MLTVEILHMFICVICLLFLSIASVLSVCFCRHFFYQHMRTFMLLLLYAYNNRSQRQRRHTRLAQLTSVVFTTHTHASMHICMHTYTCMKTSRRVGVFAPSLVAIVYIFQFPTDSTIATAEVNESKHRECR